jgi:hypothetical protein
LDAFYEAQEAKALDLNREEQLRELEREEQLGEVLPKLLVRQLQIARVIQMVKAEDKAAKAKDKAAKAAIRNALKRLCGNDPQLLKIAAWFKRGPGRAKGDPRPKSDLPDIVRAILPDASSEVDDLRNLWKMPMHYGKRNRTMKPTAIEIIARRWNIEPKTLRSYRSNRNRK